MKTFFESMKKFRGLWILVLVLVALIYLADAMYNNQDKLVYRESLDMVLATIQEEDFTLREFAVYVAHQLSLIHI